jgi:hypothetical protein
MLKKFALFILLSCSFMVYSQHNHWFYNTNEQDSGFYNHLNATTFFKNNEYFGKMLEGYTAIGYMLQPVVGYAFLSGTQLEAGAHLLKFAGRNGLFQAEPFFRIRQKAGKNLSVVMGNLYSSLHHQLIEPMYDFDHFFYNNPETGLQFLVNSRFYDADIWLDWREFILWNDPLQEKFTAGFNNKFKIMEEESVFQIDVPLQAVFTHEGGQINNLDTNIQTLCNLAPGLSFTYLPQHGFIKQIKLDGFFVYYKNMTPSRPMPYNEGYGIYPRLYLSSTSFDFETAYWQAYKYISYLGSNLYQSVSSVSPLNHTQNRSLIISKLSYGKTFDSGLKLGVRFETYYDNTIKQLDYTYGVYLIFNGGIKWK